MEQELLTHPCFLVGFVLLHLQFFVYRIIDRCLSFFLLVIAFSIIFRLTCGFSNLFLALPCQLFATNLFPFNHCLLRLPIPCPVCLK